MASQTFSKSYLQFSMGFAPLFIKKGKGAYVFDVDGNKYLDFCGSWGPLILGHAHPSVVDAVNRAASRGTSFGTVHENEILLAEKIKHLCPHIELLRFVSSGTEAVMSAVRLARAYTKKDKIIKFSGCYHGHSDYLLAAAGSGLVTFGIPSSAGVPEDFTKHTLIAPLSDIPAIEALFEKYGKEIAAIIIEPIPANNGLLLQSQEFLGFLREITKRHGALLIFDEVISGFRVAPGGASELYGIIPDLSTYGKVVGGGLPVGAFGGRADIMSLLAPLGPVYQAGTLSGNPLAMAGGLATLEFLEKNDLWRKIEKETRGFVLNLRRETKNLPISIVTIGSIFWISFQTPAPSRAEGIDSAGISKFTALFNKALDAGIYLAPSAYEVAFINAAHTHDDLSAAASKLGEIIRALY